MLIMFKFKNYGSFKDEAVFDMRAIKSYKEHPYNLFTASNGDSFLKVVSIYGANASGKSNFVDAYNCFRTIVLESFSKNSKEDSGSVLGREYFPFLLDAESIEGDIEFEATYLLNDSEYRYGFVFDRTAIKYEWLYKKSLKTNRQSTIFEREQEFEFGSAIKSTCEKYEDSIDSDVLALSFFSSLKLRTHVFREVVYCIFDILPFSLANERQVDFMLHRYFEKDFSEAEKPKLLSFLNAIDVGIKDINVVKDKDRTAVYTYHQGSNGRRVEFPLKIESDGTKHAIAIYSYVRIAVINNRGLIIDEFNNKLHPLLQKYIIDLFYEASSPCQLIYTTHDISLLDKRFIRRDQVWFTDKNDAGESSLYSLAEFKIRNDKSFRKDYLGGIYGAIPILKEFSFEED